MTLPRLRQVVLAARDLDKVAAQVEGELGLTLPFHDAGVGHFGLRNAVYAAGDTFLEIVSPVRDGTAAGRYLDRRGGDCGYMAMFQVADAAATRQRIADLGIRVVWDTTHDDIVDLHLHPKDVPGAIVAVDIVDPPGSWRWGGPEWTARVPAHTAGGIRAITVAALDPVATARRWAAVLGLPDTDGDSRELDLDGGAQHVRFVAAADAAGEGIVGATVAVTGSAITPGTGTVEDGTVEDGTVETSTVEIGGVQFERVTAEG